MERLRSIRCFRCVIWAWACLLLFVVAACSRDGDYKSVDFGPRTDIAQPVENQDGRPRMQVAVAAMISPKETFIYYQAIIDHLLAQLGYEAEMVQRKTYGEVNELLAEGDIDLAFVCTGPFVVSGGTAGFEAIATPVVRGEPFYRSYLIVHRDSEAQALADLAGKDFAFTDPESNTGTFVPRFWLNRMGTTPERFFRSFTYTYSHDNSIMAVARRLVDGAAIDGHIWEYYHQRNPSYTSQTRVIYTSEPYGSPPVVVSHRMAPTLKAALTQLFLTMHEDPEGRRILSELTIDRFTAPQNQWYAPVAEMLLELQNAGKSGDGA